MVLWITPRSFAIVYQAQPDLISSFCMTSFLTLLPSIFGYQEHCNALYSSNASSFPWLGTFTFALQLDLSLDDSFSFWSQRNIPPQRLFPWPSHLKYICFQLLSTTILHLTAFTATTTPWSPLVFLFMSSLSQFIKTWAVQEQGHYSFTHNQTSVAWIGPSSLQELNKYMQSKFMNIIKKNPSFAQLSRTYCVGENKEMQTEEHLRPGTRKPFT